MESPRALDIGFFVRVVRHDKETGEHLLLASGLVIAPGLILTCAHDLGTSPEGLYVVPLDGGMSKKASAVHVHPEYDDDNRLSDRDIALVELARPLHLDTPPPALRVVGKGVGSLLFHSLGFPDYFARKGSPARRKQLDGTLQLGSGEETHLFELRLAQRPPAANGPASGRLQGMSGAAVITARGGHVVGVFATYEDSRDTAWAVGLGPLRHPALAEPLARHGIDLIDITEDEERADDALPVPHRRYLAALTGIESYLLPKSLDFTAPWADHPAHPRRVVDRLAEGEHVMVSGPAGSGKTRLCLEAAQAAANAGWAVYHVPTLGLAADELARFAARAAAQRVLFVYSQPEGEIDVDPHVVARQAKLAARGNQAKAVALLAAAPNGSTESMLPGDTSFTLVQAPLGDHLRQVADAIITQVGRLVHLEDDIRASARAVCGCRPGLVLRIAPELALDSDRNPVGVRKFGRQSGSELSRWIAQRLADDGLTAAGGDAKRVSFAAGAAMAMMVAPQTRERLQRAVGQLFERSGSSADGNTLVDLLLSRGWLEERDGRVHPLHPVIADEMLVRALLTPEGEALSETAEWIFQAALDDSVSVRMLVDVIRRLATDYPHPGLAQLLEARCRDWVEEHCELIGKRALEFERERADEAGLIPAMLRGPLWSSIASDHLEILSRRYFSCEAEPAACRDRLQECLAALPKSEEIPEAWRDLAAKLLSGALHEEDGPLLDTVLGRPSSDPQWAKQIRELAVRWTEDHPDAASASFVLGALIRDRSLSEPDLHLVVERALDWISRHDAESGSRVLVPLISNPRLTPRQRDDTRLAVRDWLDRNSRTIDAKFVLRVMLRDPARRRNHFGEALPYALDWIEANGNSSAAWSVASQICSRDAIAAWLPTVLPWLETHVTDPAIHTILVRTLQIRSKSVTLDEERRMVRCGLSWLRANPTRWAVPEVCGALSGHARRTNLEGKERKYRQNMAVTAADADELLVSVCAWMDRFGSRNVSANTVLGLLGYYHASTEQTKHFAKRALDWLKHPRPAEDSRKVLSLLVRRGEFTEEDAGATVERVAKELESFPAFADDNRLQAGVFRFFKKYPSVVNETVRDRFAAAALGVTDESDDAEPTRPQRIPPFDVLRFLLDTVGLGPRRRRQVALSALRWLESNSTRADADIVIRRLLDEPDWSGPETEYIIDHAFEWLHRWIDADEASTNHEGPSGVLSRLVVRTELRRTDVETAFELAQRWMSRKDNRKKAAYRRIAQAFLERDDLTPDQEAQFLLNLLKIVCTGVEGQEQRLQVLKRGLDWLRDHADLPCAAKVLGPALWRVLDDDELEWDRTAVIAAAERWLRQHERLATAHFVVKPLLLLDKREGLPDGFPSPVPFALAFLEAHPIAWYSAETIRLVCRREDLSDAQRAIVLDTARSWLEGRSADTAASHVLQALARIPLTQPQREFVLAASLSWAANLIDIIDRRYESGVTKPEFHRQYEPRYLLAKLLAREDLTSAEYARVLGVALRTHRVKVLNMKPFNWELEPELGNEPLLRFALKHLDAVEDVPEIGPVLAEIQAFDLAPDTRTAIRGRSLQWLGEHASTEEAGEVCVQLARTMNATTLKSSRVLPHSLAWLRVHAGKPSTPALLSFLLRHELEIDHVAALLPFAERALADFTLSMAQSRLLASVVAQRHTPAEVASPLVRTAIEALEHQGDNGRSQAGILVDGLTKCRHLDAAQRSQVIAFVVQMAALHKTERRVAALFNRCLGMEGLGGAECDQLLGAAVAWAGTRTADVSAWPVIAAIGRFVERAETTDDGQASRVEELILSSAMRAVTHAAGAGLLSKVVDLRWCSEQTVNKLHVGTLEWFEKHYLTEQAGAVAQALWPLKLSQDVRRRLAQLVARWIREHPGKPWAGQLAATIRSSETYPALPFRTRHILEEFHAQTNGVPHDPSAGSPGEDVREAD
ncbi:serine protease [Saccharopolyspora sp. 5N102]|uniref:serine protease n=1 Tax=Saccharopolyspora sp. 5N102 TaxID=3375155 RepID=UPI0037961B95